MYEVAGAVWFVNPRAPVVALVGFAAEVGADPAPGTPVAPQRLKNCPAAVLESDALSMTMRLELFASASISPSLVVMVMDQSSPVKTSAPAVKVPVFVYCVVDPSVLRTVIVVPLIVMSLRSEVVSSHSVPAMSDSYTLAGSTSHSTRTGSAPVTCTKTTSGPSVLVSVASSVA